jgi:LysM repeat protein
MEPERKNIKETSSLSQSRKGPQRCYGATRNPENTADYKLVTHTLTLSDTLQGLAIKYGVTVNILSSVKSLRFSSSIMINFEPVNVICNLIFKFP